LTVQVLLARLQQLRRSALMRGSFAAVLLLGTGQLLAFALQSYVAVVLGTAQFGYYSVAMAWYAMALPVAKLGFDVSLLQLLPKYLAGGQLAEARGVARFGRRVPALAGLAAAACGLAWLAVASPAIHSAMAAVAIALLLVPVSAYSELTGTLLRSIRKVGASMLGDNVLRPLLAGVFVACSAHWLGVADGASAMAAYALATALVLILNASLFHVMRPVELRGSHAVVEARQWLSESVPMMLAGVVQAVLYGVDTVVLGSLNGPEQAGLFALAARLALVTLLALNAVQLVMAPMLADALARGQRAEAQAVVTSATRISLAIGGLFALLAVLAGRNVLRAFGAGYEHAYWPMVVLIVAQLVNVATGPVGFVMAFKGRRLQLVAFMAVAVAFSLAGNLVVAATYGALGSAFVALVAHSGWNLVAARYCRRSLGLDPTAWPARATQGTGLR
jgi:O-antigen/teichoic acid export membrane protein